MKKLRGQEMLENVEFEEMVYFVSGPGDMARDGMANAQGKVIAKCQNRWGYYLEIEIGWDENGIIKETVSIIRIIDNDEMERGCGAYIVR